ncbi:MAG: hypothetical protein LBE17_00710, partial [Treponema sp.]|nr:hypothetical protein [Treponema sp.]
MASKPYKSLIYGQKPPENREIPGKGREIMREKTGKIPPKVGTKNFKPKKVGTLTVSLYNIKKYRNQGEE